MSLGCVMLAGDTEIGFVSTQDVHHATYHDQCQQVVETTAVRGRKHRQFSSLHLKNTGEKSCLILDEGFDCFQNSPTFRAKHSVASDSSFSMGSYESNNIC